MDAKPSSLNPVGHEYWTAQEARGSLAPGRNLWGTNIRSRPESRTCEQETRTGDLSARESGGPPEIQSVGL